MQITIANGTLTQIQETLSAASGYVLPDSIAVTGATSSYDNSTGVITLTSLTATMSIAAEGEQEGNKVTFGNLRIMNAYIGNLKVNKIYLGEELIYEASSPSQYDYNLDGSALTINNAPYSQSGSELTIE